ncbi:ferredoxin--NADP reductase [Bacteroidota bacterium]
MSFRDQKPYKVHHIRELTDSAFVLRFDRHGMNFIAGQHILVGRADHSDLREYSVYSGEKDDYLEILVKEVKKGSVSRQLKKLQPGQEVEVESAVGFFRINVAERDKKLLFIASGTGIAPFHSFVRSYPNLDYTLLHGIRHVNESYESDSYEPHRYISCVSKDEKGKYQGHVTDYLRENPVDKDLLVYLCGNSDMILDCKDILEEQGIPNEHIFTEVYF